jgi:hypothetical protein
VRASSETWMWKGRMASAAERCVVSSWVVAVFILVSFYLVVSLRMAAAVTGENAASAAIATPLRSRARRDRTEAAGDVCAVIGSCLSAVVLRIKVRNG